MTTRNTAKTITFKDITYNISDVFAGDDINFTITVQDEASAVVDITSYAITFKLSERVDTAELFSRASTDSAEIELTDPTNGVFVIKIVSANTLNLEGTYYYECDIVDVSSKRTTLMKGTFTILPSKTT